MNLLYCPSCRTHFRSKTRTEPPYAVMQLFQEDGTWTHVNPETREPLEAIG